MRRSRSRYSSYGSGCWRRRGASSPLLLLLLQLDLLQPLHLLLRRSNRVLLLLHLTLPHERQVLCVCCLRSGRRG